MVHISLPATLLGALLTYGYFRFIDPSALTVSRRLGPGEILYFVVFLGALVAAAHRLGLWWSRSLAAGPPAPGPVGDDVRRRAIQLPWVIAGINLAGWTLAGLIWGVLWPVLTGTFEPAQALRKDIGITDNAG